MTDRPHALVRSDVTRNMFATNSGLSLQLHQSMACLPFSPEDDAKHRTDNGKDDSSRSKQRENNRQCNGYCYCLFIWYPIIWSSFTYLHAT